ncbi:MAG: Flp pilus assembly protein TadB, partial [Phenylobacterium sp.]|nr:Flp pilus assembly protein TadB [Phenylobacterium sp.]
MPVEDAMWQAARRVGLPEFNFLVISLSVQRETGGNLAETLENLEQILRRRQQMRLKIRAMSSEATASALIIGSLPFVMAILMSVVNRDYLSVLFTQPLGRLMLGGGVASLVAGSLIMRQMVKFEI